MKKLLIGIVLLAAAGGYYALKKSDADTVTPSVHAIFGGVGLEFSAAQAQVARWEKSSGQKVKITQAVRGTDNRLQQYLPHFQTPAIDVYQVDISWGPMIHEFMEDLSQHLAPEEINSIQPELLAAGTVKGKVIFLPLYVQWLQLYIRVDLLEKHCRPIPKTWEELTETARYIMAKENASRGQNDPFWGIVFMGQPYEGVTCVALSMMSSMPSGTNIFDEKGNVSLATEGNLDVWKMLHSWLHGTCTRGPIASKSTLAYQQEQARQMFQRGNALFMINWPYAQPLLKDDVSIRDKFSVSRLPHGIGGSSSPVLGGGALAVSKHSQNKKAAISLVRSMLSFESQKMRALGFGYISPLQSVVNDPEVLSSASDMSSAQDIWKSAIARPTSRFKKWSAVVFTFGAELHKFLQNENMQDPKTILQALEKDFKKETL